MFGRAPSAAHVCLRCQSRLLTRPWLRPDSTLSKHGRPSSSAAQPAEAEVEAHDDDQGISAAGPRKNWSRPSNRGVKHWRPAPIKELGVNSLGRPAEVLVLPERKENGHSYHRESNDVEPETSSNPRKLNVQESIAQELQPVTIQDIVHHITIIRDEIGSEGAYLFPASWTRARDRLTEGFTKAQLRRYIKHKLPTGNASLRNDAAKLNQKTKTDVATWLMHHIWNVQSDASQPTSVQPKKDIKLSRHDLEVVLRGKAQDMADLASQFNIKIDVFRDDAYIRLTGEQADLDVVAGFIRGWKSAVLNAEYVLPDYVAETITPGRLADVGKNHGVVPFRLDNTLGFSGFDRLSIAAAYRDLYVNTYDVRRRSQLRPRLHANLAYSTSLLPVHQTPNSVPDEGYRYRYVGYRNVAGSFENESQSMDEIINSFSGKHWKERDRGALLQPTWSVNLAETIWTKSGIPKPRSDGVSVDAIAVSDIPLLAQYLQQQIRFNTNQCGNLRDLADGDQELYRLRFTRTHRRSIEMYLSRPSPTNEEAVKPLQLRLLQFVASSTDSSLLLPHHLVDMNVTLSNVIPIFTSGEKLDPDLAPILAQVASYLEFTSNTPDLHFAATLDVDLSILYSKAEITDMGAAEAKTHKVQRLQNDQTFILQRADRVERAAFFPCSDARCILEHLSYQPLPTSLIQEPDQALQLVKIPLCHVVTAGQKISPYAQTTEQTLAQGSADLGHDDLTAAQFKRMLEYGDVDSRAAEITASDGNSFRVRRDMTSTEAATMWKPDDSTTLQSLRAGCSTAYAVVEDLTTFAKENGPRFATQGAAGKVASN